MNNPAMTVFLLVLIVLTAMWRSGRLPKLLQIAYG